MTEGTMKKNRRQQWKVGDIFTVPQLDGNKSIGQVLDIPLPNIVSCAFFDIRVSGDQPVRDFAFAEEDHGKIVAAIWTTPDLLHLGKWVVIGHQQPQLPREAFPNEELRGSRWVGAKTYGSGNVEKFLDAFYSLRAWDDWHDPTYLDGLLISPEKKPENLIYVRK